MVAKGSDLLVAALESEGVDRIFGVPGENPDVVESPRNSSIKLILTRHEQGAAFMAATLQGRFQAEPYRHGGETQRRLVSDTSYPGN